MAIASPEVTLNSQTGIDEKAAVVSLALNDIAAKVNAQLGKKPESEALIQTWVEAPNSPETIVEASEPPAAAYALWAEPSSEPVEVRHLAAEGYFQAIAYWLNEPLVAQNVYAQVLADDLPGRLKVLVEFERPPEAKRLIRFVCDRLYKLNSDVIEGVHIIARLLGAAETDWEKSVRIPTLSERRQKQVQTEAPPEALEAYSEAQNDRQTVRDQFKFFRAALMCGSAIAALFFGGFTRLILSDSLSDGLVASKSQPSEDLRPWYGDVNEPDFSQATEVSFRPASRFQSKTVEAAFETVAVIPHNKVIDPSDPTVTLLFGGQLALNDFIPEESSDIDQLFSEVDIYQQADVAMVGIAEPLANASTSLQEDFHQRTRPQAVQALESGGIDIVSLASEGNLTYGERGLAETLNNLDRQGIYRVGAGRNQQEAHRPEILEVKGQRVAYLGYNPDALKGAKSEKAGVALTRTDERRHIVEDIRAIRSEVDWVVVNYRWGDALEAAEEDNAAASDASEVSTPLVATVPEDWQQSLAHEAVDAGADLVVGYHPEHVQGAEIYRDRPIAYSLGDFRFDSTLRKDHDTAALKVSLRNQQMKVEFLPLTIHESKLQKATGEHGADILHAIRSASKTLNQPMQFPTVLKADPIYLPEPAEVEALGAIADENPEYIEPEYANPEHIEPEYKAPAPDPMMQEPDALFHLEATPEANPIDLEQTPLD